MYSDYRLDAINIKLQKARFYPLDVMVTGVTGAGKSTTLNSLFEKEVAKVGDGVDPETMELYSYRLNKLMRFWDTPGLGDGVYADTIHSKKLVDLLYKTYVLDEKEYGFIDSVLIIIEGSNRDMGTTYKLLNDIIVPNFQPERIIVAINQADVAMKGRHWDFSRNKPDDVLLKYLEEKTISIQNRVKEATGVAIKRPIYYSAQKGYNISKLFDLIIDNMLESRRELYL